MFHFNSYVKGLWPGTEKSKRPSVFFSSKSFLLSPCYWQANSNINIQNWKTTLSGINFVGIFKLYRNFPNSFWNAKCLYFLSLVRWCYGWPDTWCRSLSAGNLWPPWNTICSSSVGGYWLEQQNQIQSRSLSLLGLRFGKPKLFICLLNIINWQALWILPKTSKGKCIPCF